MTASRWWWAVLVFSVAWAAPVKPRCDLVIAYDSGMRGSDRLVRMLGQAVDKAGQDLRIPPGQLSVLVFDIRKVPAQVVKLGIEPDQLPAMAAVSVGKDGRPDKVLSTATRLGGPGMQEATTHVMATVMARLGRQLPFLGLGGVDLSSPVAQQYHPTAKQGIVIAKVLPDSPAAQADIQEGDVLVQVDGVPVTSPGQMQTLIRSHQPGDKIFLKYNHAGTVRLISVKLSAAR
ncbi:MAG TPA: PDZ domain-containing protein [Candidatus Xenobia bacterium]|jgi:membrane-associated protease RseP (regulator of RpoE activity)